jgi:hypothetical protein
MSYDKTCQELIEKINNSNVLSNEFLNNIHNYEDKVLSKNIRSVSSNSFIEKSVSTEKTYTMDNLAHKFSMEDLTKIKSLIKFAKINNIMDDVYSHKGDIKIEDLIHKKGKETQTAFIFNNTELFNLKQEVERNNKKVDLFYNETKENMRNITNLIIFLKEISTEFHKSMLLMGNKLSNVSDTLVTANKVNESSKLKFKQINNDNKTISYNSTIIDKLEKIDNTLIKPKVEPNKPAEMVKPANSPFLATRDFGPSDDDELIEKVEDKLKKAYDTGDDFINP